MVQSPSWEANWFAGSQEIPSISRNPKVYYRTHKRLPPVSILGQPNPVHIPTSHLLENHPNIIHPFTLRFPLCSPSLRFPHQDSTHPLSLHIRATCSAHLILLDCLLTPWCRVLLEKPKCLQFDKKFPAFDGTLSFINALTSVCQLSQSWANPIQSMYPHPTSWRSILIFSTHVCLGLPSVLLPSGFPNKNI